MIWTIAQAPGRRWGGYGLENLPAWGDGKRLVLAPTEQEARAMLPECEPVTVDMIWSQLTETGGCNQRYWQGEPTQYPVSDGRAELERLRAGYSGQGWRCVLNGSTLEAYKPGGRFVSAKHWRFEVR